jgi:hypothetical protein
MRYDGSQKRKEELERQNIERQQRQLIRFIQVRKLQEREEARRKIRKFCGSKPRDPVFINVPVTRAEKYEIKAMCLFLDIPIAEFMRSLLRGVKWESCRPAQDDWESVLNDPRPVGWDGANKVKLKGEGDE